MKPIIIIASPDDADTCDWLSVGWNSVAEGTAGTPEADALMNKAATAIREASNVPDAVKRLEEAGFKVWRRADDDLL